MKKIKKFGIFVAVVVVLGAVILEILFVKARLTMDKEHATVTISNSEGEVEFTESVNGTGFIDSGEEVAIRNVCKVTIAKGESIQLGFYCPACRNEQQERIDTPGLRIFYCDCPEKGDENGQAKEYFAIEVQVE